MSKRKEKPTEKPHGVPERHVLTFTFDGKRYYAEGKTEEEAIEKRALKKKALKDGARKITKQMQTRAWFAEYEKVYREPVIVARSSKDEKSLWNKHIDSFIGAMMLKDVKPLHCQSVLNRMAELGRKEKQVRKAKILMSAMFREAIENNLLIENPAANIKMPACEEDGTHRQITAEERTALLKACDILPYPHGLWAYLMLYCGLRPGETARVKWEHIDFKGSRLYIDGTKTKAARRRVPLPAALLLHIPELHAKEGYVILNADGRQITNTNMKRMWAQIVKEMHVILDGETEYGKLRKIPDDPDKRKVAPDFVPYNLRHTYCTDLQDAGVPINVAKDLMGHSSLEMTSRIYTHLTDESFENARKLIDENTRVL